MLKFASSSSAAARLATHLLVVLHQVRDAAQFKDQQGTQHFAGRLALECSFMVTEGQVKRVPFIVIVGRGIDVLLHQSGCRSGFQASAYAEGGSSA